MNIGSRQTGRERGRNVIEVGHDSEEIKRLILKCIEHGKYNPPEYIYGDGNAGRKIADILYQIELRGIVQKKIQI